MTRYRASQLTPEQSSGWFRRLLNRMSTIRTPLTWGHTAVANANRNKEPENRPEPRGAAPRQESWPRGGGHSAEARAMAPRAGVIAPAQARAKIGLRSVIRVEQRVPAAKNRELCPAAVKIDDSSQPQGQNTRLFAPSESPCANSRQKRPFLASETAKNRLF